MCVLKPALCFIGQIAGLVLCFNAWPKKKKKRSYYQIQTGRNIKAFFLLLKCHFHFNAVNDGLSTSVFLCSWAFAQGHSGDVAALLMNLQTEPYRAYRRLKKTKDLRHLIWPQVQCISAQTLLMENIQKSTEFHSSFQTPDQIQNKGSRVTQQSWLPWRGLGPTSSWPSSQVHTQLSSAALWYPKSPNLNLLICNSAIYLENTQPGPSPASPKKNGIPNLYIRSCNHPL